MSQIQFLRRNWKAAVAICVVVICAAVVATSIWFSSQNNEVNEQENSSSTSQFEQPIEVAKPVVIDNAGKQLTDVYGEAGVNLGFLHSTRFDDFKEPFPLPNRAPFSEATTRPSFHPIPLSQLINPVTEPQKQGRLQWEKFGIDAPILYAPFSDLFATQADGSADFTQAVDTSSIDSPIQQRLRGGVVHLPFSPLPGEAGNSYIIGHTSNYINVESEYNEVLGPLLNSVEVGQKFTIIDHRGRTLPFTVFEALAVSESDLTEAYKNFEGRRVVTLQGSILENGIPTKRYLVRAELVIE